MASYARCLYKTMRTTSTPINIKYIMTRKHSDAKDGWRNVLAITVLGVCNQQWDIVTNGVGSSPWHFHGNKTQEKKEIY